MHYEFAFDSLNVFIEKSENADFDFLQNWATEPEIMNYAAGNCDDFISDICKTIKSMTGFKKPTAKQKNAIAAGMLKDGRTARSILIDIYGAKIEALFLQQDKQKQEEESKDVAAQELSKLDIKLSKRRVAFGKLSDFICNPGDERKGNTYRATVSAIRDFENNFGRRTATARIDGELIAVTISELKKLNQNDCDVFTFSANAMELQAYINKHYSGNQSDFARAMGVDRSKVNLWIKSGWVIMNGKLYSSRRDIP